MAVIPIEGATCRQCGEWRAQADFYLRNPLSGNRYNRCRFCHIKDTTIDQEQRFGRTIFPQQHDTDRTEKRCKGCEQVLPIEQFSILNQRTGKRRERCVPCHNEANRQYKARNHEKVLASAARYRDENRETYNERCRKWHEDHKDVSRERSTHWKSQNKDKLNSYTHKRRARLSESPDNYTAQEWKALKAKYDHRCLMCGLQEPEIKLTVDHVIPVNQGGSNGIHNIQPLCKSCNSKKYRNVIDLRQRVVT